ncbi:MULTISPECIES: glycine zipper 2TM domain-containing protein [unclassified Methylophilus]|uniref:glycine zipper 2TM domain-containing protein n=1 Tax=unclassified Methylophilus TaxID=2630143 RepID=UPI00037772EA|nr:MULTISPECIES: glycine zipper 2TM domain-containing protein [unclassified Methylophilus]
MRKLILSSVVMMAASQSAFADAEYIDRARVLSVAPQVQQINQPRQECRTEYVRESVYESNRSNTGAIVGGVAGGLLGSTIGRGNGRIAAAAVGAGVGAIVGDRVGNQNTYGNERIVTRPIEQCVMVDQWQTVTTGYMVNYEYQGRQYSTMMDRDPGPVLDVAVLVRPNVVQIQPMPAPGYRPAAMRGHGPRQHRQYW